MRVIEGYAPSRAIRMGNDGPSTGRPAGQRPPRRNQPHAPAAPRHAHAHAGQRKPAGAPQRDRRSSNAPRSPRG
jgi:ATP-dependent RNA helicase RhlE